MASALIERLKAANAAKRAERPRPEAGAGVFLTSRPQGEGVRVVKDTKHNRRVLAKLARKAAGEAKATAKRAADQVSKAKRQANNAAHKAAAAELRRALSVRRQVVADTRATIAAVAPYHKPHHPYPEKPPSVERAAERKARREKIEDSARRKAGPGGER